MLSDSDSLDSHSISYRQWVQLQSEPMALGAPRYTFYGRKSVSETKALPTHTPVRRGVLYWTCLRSENQEIGVEHSSGSFHQSTVSAGPFGPTQSPYLWLCVSPAFTN